MKNPLHLLFGLALLLASGVSLAGPAAGVGVAAGLVAAHEQGVSSRGMAIGADIQYLVNSKWSLDPYFLVTYEEAAGSEYIADGMAGLQLRRWFGDWYVGGHLSSHDRLALGNGASSNNPGLLAPGLLFGVERASGWGANAQLSFEPTGGAYRTSLVVDMSYRWREVSR